MRHVVAHDACAFEVISEPQALALNRSTPGAELTDCGSVDRSMCPQLCAHFDGNYCVLSLTTLITFYQDGKRLAGDAAVTAPEPKPARPDA